MLEVAQTKAHNVGYAERRAQEIAMGEAEEYSMEGRLFCEITSQSLVIKFPIKYWFVNFVCVNIIDEVTLVMEEITEKEKDLK